MSEYEDGGPIVCAYHKATGRSHQDCVFLGQRYREEWGPDPEDSDFWAIGNRPTSDTDAMTTLLFSWKDWLTGIWRSPAGIVYISDATVRGVHRYEDIFDVERPPADYLLEVALEGIWGLDDEHVFTWGTRKSAGGGFEWPVFRFDGERWAELPMPGFAVMDLHGLSPDRLFAVGFGGGVARWDGTAWTRLEVPTGEVLLCVSVAGEDEVYACGNNGTILRGGRGGWEEIARMPEGMPAYAVARFAGALWVAGGSLGLYRLAEPGGELELRKTNIEATWLEVGDRLVITADNFVAGTADGESFFGAGIGVLCQLTADKDIIGWEDHLQ